MVYKVLALKVKRPKKVDKITGYLPLEVVKFTKQQAKSAMDVLLRNNEVSGYECLYEPATKSIGN